MLEPTFRPLITIIRLPPDRSAVEVALDMEGRMTTGFADIEGDDTTHAACRATVTAVQGLLPRHLSLTFDWYQLVDPGEDETPVVNSAVTLRIEQTGHVEHLVGAAFVRHDPDVAAVRATLDGMKRRLVSYIFDEERERPDGRRT